MLISMTSYETLKQFLFPDIAIWESHLITIVFSSISATVAAHIIFKNQHRILRKLYEKERETAHLNEELLNTIYKLENIKKEVDVLSYLLPICSSCKKIRDDKGYWRQVEEYIHTHSGINFTHSLCPECAKKLYPYIKIN